LVTIVCGAGITLGEFRPAARAQPEFVKHSLSARNEPCRPLLIHTRSSLRHQSLSSPQTTEDHPQPPSSPAGEGIGPGDDRTHTSEQEQAEQEEQEQKQQQQHKNKEKEKSPQPKSPSYTSISSLMTVGSSIASLDPNNLTDVDPRVVLLPDLLNRDSSELSGGPTQLLLNVRCDKYPCGYQNATFFRTNPYMKSAPHTFIRYLPEGTHSKHCGSPHRVARTAAGGCAFHRGSTAPYTHTFTAPSYAHYRWSRTHHCSQRPTGPSH
jgi:hypothetical protein